MKQKTRGRRKSPDKRKRCVMLRFTENDYLTLKNESLKHGIPMAQILYERAWINYQSSG